MRNVIFAINVTVDGCCDHTKVGGSDEILEHFTQLLRDVDLFVYGRKTYQLMVPYWPDIAKNPSGGTKAEIDYAQAFTSINKVVFSQSLNGPVEKNTRIVSTNLQDEILKLKQAPGKNILTGGIALPSQLIELGLVDELHIVVHPIIAGEGRRLLDTTRLQERLRLKLVESETLKSGSVVLHYLKQ